jgi:hypothetical protein
LAMNQNVASKGQAHGDRGGDDGCGFGWDC